MTARSAPVLAPAQRLRVLVSGMIGAVPQQGGATWAVLQYLLGFAQLGHDVWFVEPIRAAQLQPAGTCGADSDNVRYLGAVLDRFGLGERWACLIGDQRVAIGPAAPHLQQLAADADLIVDLAGSLAGTPYLEGTAVRLYVDLDPGFTQMWHAYEGLDLGLACHDHYATVGLAIGRPGCPVPTLGLEWLGILPPVVLDQWPAVAPAPSASFTTIANWRGYGSIHHAGVHYGQKAHSVRSLINLPRRVAERIELALSIHAEETVDIAQLNAAGWLLTKPAILAAQPESYRHYVQASKGEIGLAKSGYVNSKSGWFSDRSACYLASGRPVVAHDTGLTDVLPVGDGLLTFGDTAEAAVAIESVAADYPRHCRWARAFAEDYLDARIVLDSLLGAVLS